MKEQRVKQDQSDLSEREAEGVWVNWNPPAPRTGGMGSWDRFVGPGATGVEENLQLVLGGIIGVGCVFLFWLAQAETANVWQWLFIVFLALDIGGGIVTNATSAAKRWYHRPGHSSTKHMMFVGAHLVHIGLVAFLFSDQPIQFALSLSAMILISALLVVKTQLYLQRPVAIGLTMIVILIGQLPLFEIDGLNWFVPALMLKLVVGHALKEAPFQPNHGHGNA